MSNDVISDKEIIDDDLDLLDEEYNREMYTYVFVENSYVALYSVPELFYLLKVLEKDVADDVIIDIYGHTVQKGSEYITRHYLEKVSEKKDRIYYKELAKTVYVYLVELFCPSVPISQDHFFLLFELSFKCPFIWSHKIVSEFGSVIEFIDGCTSRIIWT